MMTQLLILILCNWQRLLIQAVRPPRKQMLPLTQGAQPLLVGHPVQISPHVRAHPAAQGSPSTKNPLSRRSRLTFSLRVGKCDLGNVSLHNVSRLLQEALDSLVLNLLPLLTPNRLYRNVAPVSQNQYEALRITNNN